MNGRKMTNRTVAEHIVDFLERSRYSPIKYKIYDIL